MALALGHENGRARVEMRNRFSVGDVLEVLSPSEISGKTLTVTEITGEEGNVMTADKVQAIYSLRTDLPLEKYDILRKRT